MLSKLLLLAGLGAGLTSASHVTRRGQHHHHTHARRGLGQAIVKNNCKYDVWMWSVDSVVRPPHTPYQY